MALQNHRVAAWFAVSLSGVLVLGSLDADAADAADAHQHAHVHGTATLGIAVDRDVLSIDLDSPLDSVLGFEHRATTEAERASVAALRARLKAPGDLFGPTPAAECTLTDARADSSAFAAVPTASTGSAPATRSLAAGSPATQSSDPHADLDAHFAYRCAHADRLVSIETKLFDAFARLQRIDVAVATERGQFKRDLKRPARTIDLSRR